MPAVVESLSVIYVSQATTGIPVSPSLVGISREEDKLVIVVKFAKPCVFQLTSFDPMDAHGDIGPIQELKMYLPFSNVKQTCNESSFRRMMKIDLTDLGVRERLQEEMFDKLFPEIYAAETCDVPIEVIVADVSIVSRDSDDEEGDDEEVSNFTPAAEDAVEGLEKVRLDADIIGQTPICGICRKDYALDQQEELVTRMPCSHCYHQDCIGSWLRVNHRCPLCRYSMPVEIPDDDLEA